MNNNNDYCKYSGTRLTHSLLKILPKNAFWSLSSGFLVTVVLLRAKTYHKSICRSYTSRPSDSVAKYQLVRFGHAQKAKLGLDFYFSLSLLPSFFAFLASFFFFCWAFSRLYFGGKVFRKAFRILGLGERKGRWVVEQDFHGNFQVSVTWFFAFFSGVLDWIVLNLVWFERSLHSAHVSVQSCPWPLKLMMSQTVVESTWTRAAQGRMG